MMTQEVGGWLAAPKHEVRRREVGGRESMTLTRREFGKLALAGLPAAAVDADAG
jgi:hypothetical protein